MEKIKSLNRYQKGVLIFMIAMALVFAVIYPMTISQVCLKFFSNIQNEFFKYHHILAVKFLAAGRTCVTKVDVLK